MLCNSLGIMRKAPPSPHSGLAANPGMNHNGALRQVQAAPRPLVPTGHMPVLQRRSLDGSGALVVPGQPFSMPAVRMKF